MQKSKTLSALIVVAFVVGIGLGYSAGASVPEQRIRDLETQSAQNNFQIQTLTAQRSQLQGWLTGNVSLLQKTMAEQDRLETWLAGNKTSFLGIYFSPNGGCKDQVISWINRANISVHVLIYSFTLDDVSDALMAARQRGVEVRIVFEKSQISQYSEYQKLRAAGIPVRNDTNSYSMHNKVMIIDGEIVLTGSFNWSAAAENENDENLIIIKSIPIAAIYEKEFTKIWNQSI